MYRKRTNQLKRMKTTENIKLHIIHCKLVYLFALVWLLFHSTPLLHKSGKFHCIGIAITLIACIVIYRSDIYGQVWGIVYLMQGIPEPPIR